MNRREFLRLRKQGNEETAVISCAKLYVEWQHLVCGSGKGVSEQGSLNDSEWWSGEPPLLIDQQSPEEFIKEIYSEIADLDSIEVTESKWLADDELRVRVHDMLKTYEINGGTVSFTQTAKATSHSEEMD